MIAARATRVAVAGCLCALISACATPPTKPADSSVVVSPPTSAETPAVVAVSAAPPSSVVAEDAAAASPWQRMRARFAMPGCEYSADVARWASRYSAQPQRFAASWRAAMPYLLLVLDDIERRNLPGEFALLPYVESQYQSVAADGQRPAGAWQLMPRTARDQGLRISRDYDARLDAIEATRVALDMIERYDREFGDWRVATMAFNAGEYRVKRELGERSASSLDADALARLKLSPITHEHLAKMLALACIVGNPSAFDVVLPEPDANDAFVAHSIEGAVDLRVAAAFAGVPFAEVQRMNAAHLGHRRAPSAPAKLLLPRERVTRFVASQNAMPGLLSSTWKPLRVGHTTTLADMAKATAMPPIELAAANNLDAESVLPAGTLLLVPDARGSAPQATPMQAPEHVVRRGDTLSAIAHRYGVRIAELLHWNRLHAKSVLRTGARLRIGTP